MQSKFLKPALGVLGALAFSVSILSFTNVNAKSISSDEVTVKTSNEIENLDSALTSRGAMAAYYTCYYHECDWSAN